MNTILQEVKDLVIKGYIIPEDVVVLDEDDEIKVLESKGLIVEESDFDYALFSYKGVKFALQSESRLDGSLTWDIYPEDFWPRDRDFI